MANKPDIRFREFNEEWEKTQLKNEVDYSSTGVRICDVIPDGKYDLYDANDVVGKVNTYACDNAYVSIIKDGSGVGRCRLLPKESNVLGTMGVITSKGDNNIDFIYNHLRSKDFKQHIISGAIPHVYFSNYGEDTLFIPSLPEQQKIGEFFKTLDELIAAKQDELTKLQQLKAALLEQMFPCEEGSKTTDGGGTSQVIDTLNLLHALNPTASNPTTPSLTAQSLTISHTPNTPRIRFKGFTDEWEKKTIDELFILRNGYTPSKANPEYWTNGTIPWFRMEDIRENGHILKDASQHITPQAVKGSGLFPAGCIIMSTTATIGEHALLIADSLANQRFTVFQTVNRWKTIDMMFFYHYCFILGEWCRRNVNVGGLNAVNISDLRQHKIPFPSMAEQKLIAGVMTAQEEKIKAAKQQIQKLQTIKQAMLQKMFVA